MCRWPTSPLSWRPKTSTQRNTQPSPGSSAGLCKSCLRYSSVHAHILPKQRLNSLCCICSNKLLETQSYKWNQMIKILDLSLCYSERVGWMSDVHWVLMCVLSRHITTTLTLIFSDNVFFKSVNIWEDVSAGLKGHHVYGEWLVSLHNIFVNAACCSSELITTPRDVFAFPIEKWEPSSNQKISSHFLVLLTPFPSRPHSRALSLLLILLFLQFLN